MKRSQVSLVAVGALTLASAVLDVSWGQSSDTSDNSAGKIEEIVVTAQRRVENLQNVPVSVQVIGSQALAEQNQNSLTEMSQTVPAVHVSAGALTSQMYIRGIGSGENTALDQSVAIFIDDIYHGRSRQSEAAFLDLDRVEVLKGPQSTFFGNNAIAGALNIVTKKPGDTFAASARALYGMFGQYALEGAVGGPITDTLGARIAITRNGDDRGWIDNVSTGEKVPRINNGAARLTLVFRPVDDLETTLKAEASQHRTSGSYLDQPLQWINCPPPAPFTPAFGQFGGCAAALALNAKVPGTVPIGLDNKLTTGLPGQYSALSTFESVLTINYQHWGQTFTSVSGFNNYHANANIDEGGLPAPVLTSQQPEKYHQFSQELRVASPTDQPIQYMVGGYFQTDQLASYTASNTPFLSPLVPLLGPFFAPLLPYLPLASYSGFSQDERVYSVFGSVRWNVTDRLRLNAGLRGSWVEKDLTGGLQFGTGTQTFGGFVPMPAPLQSLTALLFGLGNGTQPYHQSFRAGMPSAGIEYQVNPRAMAYFSYSRGFKAGGVNGELGAIGPPENFAYGPEYVNAYELGLKSKWFDDTVLLNVDLFRSDYKDLQVNTLQFLPALNGYTTLVKNAAASQSQGVELESQWAVTKDFRLGANITYLDSKYTNFPNAPQTILQQFCAGTYVLPGCSQFPNPVPAFTNISGQRTNFAPLWSGNITASYSIPLPREYKFITTLDPYFTSSYYFANASGNDPFLQIGGYIRLDGRLSLEAPGGHWNVDLIGRNLTDRVIQAYIYSQGLQASKEQPRNVAVQFRYKY